MSWNIRTMKWALEGLGLTLGSKLPDEGAPPKIVNGVVVWIYSKKEKAEACGFMRVMCLCPTCNSIISVSRLPQHENKGACLDRFHKQAEQRQAYRDRQASTLTDKLTKDELKENA